MNEGTFEVRREDMAFEYHRTLLSSWHPGIKLEAFHGRRLVGYGDPSELTAASAYDAERVLPLAVLDVPQFFTSSDGTPGFQMKTVGDAINFIKGLMSSILFADPDQKGGEVFMREMATELTSAAIKIFYEDLIFVSRTFPRPTDIYEVQIGELDDASASRILKLPRTASHEPVYLETAQLNTQLIYDISPSTERYAFNLHTVMPHPRRISSPATIPIAIQRSEPLIDTITKGD